MTADTIDHRFQATPGQVAAIERDGFLVAHGARANFTDPTRVGQPEPTTKPCPECGGGYLMTRADGGTDLCPACNGDGTVPIVVEVVVPERECPDCEGTCPECGRWNNGDHDPEFDPVCWYCESKPCRTCGGTIPARTLLRGTAEAVPVVEWLWRPLDDGPYLATSGEFMLLVTAEPLREPHDVTHHFADVPRPEVGDTAWIIRGAT